MQALVLNANSSEAQLYHSENLRTSPLQEIKTLTHEKSRKHIRDLVSERWGGGRSRIGRLLGHFRGRGSCEKKNPKDHEAEVFASQLADTIKQAKLTHPTCEQLIVIAPPHFEGLMRQHIQQNLYKQFKEISYLSKDYIHLKADELLKIVQEKYVS